MTLAAVARDLRAAGIEFRFDEPLAAHTTFRVGGSADGYCEPGSVSALIDVVRLCQRGAVPFFVLGAGSNVLFSDEGRRGMVISMRAIRGITASSTGLDAAAGEPLPNVIAAAEEQGSRSLGFLAGIPGTVGGSAATNAGIPGRAMADVIESVTVIGDADQAVQLAPSECGFGYRTSRIRDRRFVVLSAKLRFDEQVYDPAALLTRRRATQPIGQASAGCIFRNPPGESAGALIDRAELKGFTLGQAQVSEKHANFIVNLGGASSAEICKLIDIVRQKVYNTYQVSLDLEVEVVTG
ncbi:MAG: UDP-N-acetylmuramate dehydrogenase [Candidatus Bipolaricaulota bacterium]|nr:UDP-N-acetylmuramate dehydrogenase [Candidatus Bipolaricaulota bacterium]